MSDNTINVSESNFQSEVLDCDVPVVVDFWAPWCGPCHMVGPVLMELDKEYGGKVKFVKLNTDENQNIAVKYGIMGIPTIKIFKGGEEIDSLTGAMPKGEFKKFIDKALSS